MFNTELIKRKQRHIYNYLEDLKRYVLSLSLKEVIKQTDKQYIAERLFQLIVDSMIDINTHIVKMSEKYFDDMQSTFYILSELKILPEKFAEKIAPVVGVRNMIVHRYEKLDKKLFLQNLYKSFGDFAQYLKYIDEFLKKNVR